MANQEHLDILKQGVDEWNRWREDHPDIKPDLTEIDLRGAKLEKANLRGAKLEKANLRYTDLQSADLSNSDLSNANLEHADLLDASLSEAILRAAKLHGADIELANLSGADLSGAQLSNTDLMGAVFEFANLSGADLSRADLRRADLSDANLTGAYLYSADLSEETILMGADFTKAILGWTTFGDVDLSVVKGLEAVKHREKSFIDIHTIYRSGGNIPEVFLRGIGTPNTMIEYIHSLVGKPIDFYSCFISYSSKDQKFAERLYADLQSNAVRCWFAPEDMKIGDKIRSRIDAAIRIYDKLLLVLSKNSVESGWVEKEVETAFEKERLQNKLVLFPIRLDETAMQTTQAWAADIRRTRHIGDFRQWKHHDDYQKALSRLLRDLKAEPPRRL